MCLRHGHTIGLHKPYCENEIPRIAWEGNPAPGVAEVRVWGLHDGDALHLIISDIDETWEGDEGGVWWDATWGAVTYAATGVMLDDDLADEYRYAFHRIARGFFQD